LFRKLQLIDDASRDLDLRVPPSNHFERLIRSLASVAFDPRHRRLALGLSMERAARRSYGPVSRQSHISLMGRQMIMTKRKSVSVGEMLREEFMRPLGLTQTALAEAMGVERRLVNELCNGATASAP
jgi:hypothetical protein